MTRFQRILNRLLLGWGIFCAGCLIVLAIAIAYQFGPGKVSTKTASNHDIRHVLNWSELGEERTEEVLHSYIAASSFSGDSLEAHAIRISHVDKEELTQKEHGGGWFRGDKLTGVVADAMTFVGAEGLPSAEIPWFPTEQELRSAEFYLYPWSIYYHGTKPTAVKLIFIQPEKKLVFYLAAKN